MIHRPFRIRRVIATTAAFITLATLSGAPACAAGSNMPWEQPLQPDPAIGRRPGRQDHGGHHHHRHRPDAGVRRYLRRLSPADPDRIRPLDRFRGQLFLPVVLLLRRRSAGLMEEGVPGFAAPVHRALTEHILLGGAPRAVAILNGTLAAALGLGLRLWLAGLSARDSRSGRRGLGREARSAVRRRGAPPFAHPRPSLRLRHAHDEPH